MSVTSVDKDYEGLTLTVTADFTASVEAVWQLWADPRKLERWWGPPTYPATVEVHEFQPGGAVRYFMTGPEGDKHGGWWRFDAIDAPHSLSFTDGFADDDGNPSDAMPVTTTHVTHTEHGNGTRMHLRSTFATREQMDQLIAMGVAEGLAAAMGQMDALLA